MGSIVVTESISLDGVIEAPGPQDVEDFRYKGWAFEHNSGEEGDRWKLEEILESKALLLGRVTYETFAAVWPAMSGPMADKLNAMPTYVVSSTLAAAEWTNATVLDGDLVTEVTKLRERIDGEILVYGSQTLVQGLVEHDLVDELRLTVYPVVLGTGRRLFGELGDKRRLRLTESKVFGGGAMLLVYQPEAAAG
jgi:dihydrofolate reductase